MGIPFQATILGVEFFFLGEQGQNYKSPVAAPLMIVKVSLKLHMKFLIVSLFRKP